MVTLPQVSSVVDPIDSTDGYRLSTQKEFLVMAPAKVRPTQTYEMYVTLFSLHYNDITVRAVLSQDNEEYSTSQVVFYEKGTKRLQLMVPETIKAGEHKLVVQGLVSGGRGDPIFHNETVLIFDPKYVSLFIQTDKPMYYPPQTVLFRIIGVTPDLLPVGGEDMTIYVVDSLNNIVRRWLNQELQFGLYSNRFQLTYPTQVGTWHMVVDAYGTTYKQPFEVEFFYRRIFEVNITTPLYIFDTDWGMMGTLYAEHNSGLAASGNATLSLRVRNPDGTFLEGEIRREVAYFIGTTPFSFSMMEMTNKWGDLVGKELFVKGWLNDYYFMEVQNGTSVTRVIHDGIVMKRLGKKYRTFKPGVPFTVYFAVARTDGTRYKGTYNRQVLVEVSHEADGPGKQYNERVIIPNDAIVRYEVTPRTIDKKIRIVASHLPTGSPVEVWAYRYFSKSKRFISVTTSTEVPMTEEYMTFTVRSNFVVPEIYYIITAAGNILLGNTLTMMSQQKTFSVALSRKMSPMARMVVYCVKNEEILIDTLTFFVRDSRLHNSNLTLNLGKDLNYHTIELIGRGYPGAFISINGMDYEWYKRGADTFLDEEKLITELMSYDEPSESPYKHIWYHDSERWDESVFFNAHSGGVDFTTTLNVSGLVALSDMNFTIKQEYTACNRSMGVGICLDETCYDLSKTCDGWPDCKYDAFDEITCPMEEWELPKKREPDIKNLHKFFRYFDDTSWAWRTEYVKPNGRVEIKLNAPETSQPYVISGFILHPEYGLSLFKQPVQHDVTRRFWVISEYPKNIRRGEQIGIRLAVYNYWNQDIEALITLHGGETYRFIHVEDFGYVSSYSPRVSAGDVQIMVEIEAGHQKYVHFPVLPIIEQGEVVVKISAFSDIDRDMEEIRMHVTYEGVANDDHIPFLMDLNNKGSQLAPYFDIPMPQQFIVPGHRELLYIPGSNVAYVHVFGDVVSPGFFEDHLDAGNTVSIPDDSAEGYMYDYAINLQTLRYLQRTRALSDEVAQKALEYMESILMRQFAYMQPDGSFKQFRRMSKSCVWVTSFILRYLHKTLMTDWAKQVYIDLELMNKIARWLVQQQNEEGAFVETSDSYYDRNMWNVTVDPDGVEHVWHIPVTAHVVITFATTQRLTGDAKIQSDIARDKAARYLGSKVPFITDPFQMAITAYALQLAKHKDRDEAYIKLQSMRRRDEHMYWSAKEIEPNPYQSVNAKYYIKTRMDYVNLENAVMATSYALQLYLQHNDMTGALPIMRWLMAQHNGFMAWSSTQDTLLALEALTEFALFESNREFFNINANIAATGRSNWGGQLNVNRTNFYLLQEFKLEEAWGEISVGLTGTGYGYIGLTAEWNVDKQHLVDNPSYDTFEITVDEKRFSGRNASTMVLSPCIRWLRTDLAPVTGMVAVQVEVPTGYGVNRDEIMKLYWSGVPGLRRVRFRDDTLIVLLEYVRPDQPTCFTFEARRWYPVANISITHGINVFEYAETGVKWLHIYDTYTLFHLHICQVCGSFQCPYCPNYNKATNLMPPSSTVVAFFLMLTHFVIAFLHHSVGVGIV